MYYQAIGHLGLKPVRLIFLGGKRAVLQIILQSIPYAFPLWLWTLQLLSLQIDFLLFINFSLTSNQVHCRIWNSMAALLPFPEYCEYKENWYPDICTAPNG